jgi:hypothetical protein
MHLCSWESIRPMSASLPYAPVHAPSPHHRRARAFLKVNPEARAVPSPHRAGFVGADAVARRPLATRHGRVDGDQGGRGHRHERRGALGSREHLWACSAPAGPALEGAQIRHGMRRRWAPSTASPRREVTYALHTIGEASALGHLRLRLIDAIAVLLDAASSTGPGSRSRPPRPASAPARLARDHARGEARVSSSPVPGESGATQELLLTPGERHPPGAALQGGHQRRGGACSQRIAGVPEDKVARAHAWRAASATTSRYRARSGSASSPACPSRASATSATPPSWAPLALLSRAGARESHTIARGIEHVSLRRPSDFRTSSSTA